MTDKERVNICRDILDNLYKNPATGENKENAALVNVGRTTFALNSVYIVLFAEDETEDRNEDRPD